MRANKNANQTHNALQHTYSATREELPRFKKSSGQDLMSLLHPASVLLNQTRYNVNLWGLEVQVGRSMQTVCLCLC